jgi:transcriptional regulator with XRE-family HTH domain
VLFFARCFEGYAMPGRQTTDDPLLMEGFGERLRQLRLAYVEQDGEHEHTKAQWARRLKVSPAMYGRWEAGKHLPKFLDLLRISLLFRVDPNYLIAGVLSAQLRPWLYRSLKASNPELLDEADYWQRRNEAFWQVSRALQEQGMARAESPKPPIVFSAKRKTPRRQK